jgi:pimeloyl-ACP methyl ester carboxylesterase
VIPLENTISLSKHDRSMTELSAGKHSLIPVNTAIKLVTIFLLLASACNSIHQQQFTEEITFDSGDFQLVGSLNLPARQGPFPLVLFVHGDGPNDRTAGGTYLPIMARMQRAGYATFAWDKPGTGESTGQIDRNHLGEQRAQIILDAIEVIKTRPEIDSSQIGLWGISQAGFVMPRVLSLSEDISFMIAVSCPGEPGVEQGAYLVAAQAVCNGLPVEELRDVKTLISTASRAQTYQDYVYFKSQLADYPALKTISTLGFSFRVTPEAQWHADDPSSETFFDPMPLVAQTSIPVLAFFGEKDTQVDPQQGMQAYLAALAQAGEPRSRVEWIPGGDHNLVQSRSGCLAERDYRSQEEWTNYVPTYLDVLETWLRDLRR